MFQLVWFDGISSVFWSYIEDGAWGGNMRILGEGSEILVMLWVRVVGGFSLAFTWDCGSGEER